MFYIPGIIIYYGDYCSWGTSCETSDKGELDIDTGKFTIFQSQIVDEGFYYYKFYVPGDPDTGTKYELNLTVYDQKISNTLFPLTR